jgi:hypothetical protein
LAPDLLDFRRAQSHRSPLDRRRHRRPLFSVAAAYTDSV